MKYVAMIQARVDSSRLRNKVLMEVVGKPILQHVIERVQKSQRLNEVIVVTSIEKSNLPILALCANLGVRVFAGAENDVLDRYYQAARLWKPDYVVRVTGDCPLFDGSLLDVAIDSLKPSADYLGMISETFADGLDIEIIKFDALYKSWKNARLQSQREHVTQYILQNPELFELQDFVSSIGNFGSERWTLDEIEDFRFISAILTGLAAEGKETFGYQDVLRYLDRYPELRSMNQKYSRNEGLKRSLANDYMTDATEE